MNFSKNDFDIKSLNQISKYEIIKPNYKQDLSKKRFLQFVFLPNNKVLLLGSMDIQYPYWVSITNIDDIKTNALISNSILFDDFTSFISIWDIKLRELLRYKYHRSFFFENNVVKTPFGTIFSSDSEQIKKWGELTAKSILKHYQNLKNLCAFRECDGKYENILNEYLKILKTKSSKDIVKDYKSKENLIKIIQSEDYLFLSDNEIIAKVYLEVTEKINDLYNRYMTIIK